MAESNIEVKVTDNTKEFKKEFEKGILQALEAIGSTAEGYAMDNLRNAGFKHPTGNLMNSITHVVVKDKQEVYIGSAVEYAPWHEFGTGIYAEGEGGGRTDVPWLYVDEEGVGHRTSGVKAQHYLKRAIQDHTEEYQTILEAALSGK